MLDPEASFDAFCQKKKIDRAAWAAARPAQAAHYAALYDQMGALSFDHSHKFLINDWRLDFPLAALPSAPSSAPLAAPAGPASA